MNIASEQLQKDVLIALRQSRLRLANKSQPDHNSLPVFRLNSMGV